MWHTLEVQAVRARHTSILIHRQGQHDAAVTDQAAQHQAKIVEAARLADAAQAQLRADYERFLEQQLAVKDAEIKEVQERLQQQQQQLPREQQHCHEVEQAQKDAVIASSEVACI